MIEKDPWEEKYIKNLKDSNLIAWGDSEAFHRYPKYSHIYDKFILSKLISKVRTWDLSYETPDKFPVFCKPTYNPYGLGKDSYLASTLDEIEHTNGMIAQEYLKGIHYSTDYIIRNGAIIDSYTFIGHKNFYGDFILWESSYFPDKISRDVEMLLQGYTGVANFESINGKIIEGHLRPSLQFYDICNGFLEKIPEFMKTRNWNKVKKVKSYSKVLRTKHTGKVKLTSIPLHDRMISSVQVTFEDDIPLSESDPASIKKRYAVVNGYNLDVINKYSLQLKNYLIKE